MRSGPLKKSSAADLLAGIDKSPLYRGLLHPEQLPGFDPEDDTTGQDDLLFLLIQEVAQLRGIIGKLIDIHVHGYSYTSGYLEALRVQVGQVTPQRRNPSKPNDELLQRTAATYLGRCPCCNSECSLEDLVLEHWDSPSCVELKSLWYVCRDCNINLRRAGSAIRQDPQFIHPFKVFQLRLARLGDGPEPLRLPFNG